MNVSATALPTVRWKCAWIHAVLCTTEFIMYDALMAPPMPPTAKSSIARTTLENVGFAHGSLPSQSSRPLAPLARPAASIEAVIVNAVMKLGNRIHIVIIEWRNFHGAG